MGGDGQALMNKRKHLLAFQIGLKRARGGAGEGSSTSEDYSTPDPLGWSMCTHSSDALSMNNGSDAGGAILTDYLGNLYLREKALSSLIERQRLAKVVGGTSAAPTTTAGRDAVKTKEAPGSASSELQAAANAHMEAVHSLAHVNKFNEDFVEISPQCYNVTKGGACDGLSLKCSLSGLVIGAGDMATSSAAASLASSSAPSSSSSLFVCLRRCGHCFNSNALQSHFSRVMRVGGIAAGRSNAAPEGGTVANSNEPVGVVLCCPICEVPIIEGRPTTEAEWSLASSAGRSTDNASNQHWFEQEPFLIRHDSSEAGKKAAKKMKRPVTRAIIPLVQSVASQLKWR